MSLRLFSLAILAAGIFTLPFVFGDRTDPVPSRMDVQAQTSPDPATTIQIRAAGNHQKGTLRFEVDTPTVPSGWTTLSFTNQTVSDHFVLLYKVPQAGLDAADAAGQTILQHWYENITVPFQEVYTPYINGSPDGESFGAFTDELFAVLGERAPWFLDPGAVAAGGPGFLGSGQASATTVFLEPGTYVAECYVKDVEERFHSYGGETPGMLSVIEVTNEASGAPEPERTFTIHLRKPENGGMKIPEAIPAGKHVVAVQFDEQMQHEHFSGTNAQLAHLPSETRPDDLTALSDWMDWRWPGQLVQSSPAGTRFMGGAMEMTEGHTAYVHVRLRPGRYAWIAEVPSSDEKGMLRPFIVSGSPKAGR